MHLVAFITTESGPDLMVSFAIQTRTDPGEVRSLTLQRTPAMERFLPEHQRGAHLSLEGDPEQQEDYLRRVEYDPNAATVRLTTTRAREHELDVRRVEPAQLGRMGDVLGSMNFDHTIEWVGLR